MKRSRAIIMVIVIAIFVVVSFFYASNQFSAYNTSKNITNSNILNNTTLNNSTLSNQNQSNNSPPTDIFSDNAKELAKKYAGPGTTLGNPVLTTYKKVKAWQVPVYTLDHRFINNIYIDARTGEKVD